MELCVRPYNFKKFDHLKKDNIYIYSNSLAFRKIQPGAILCIILFMWSHGHFKSLFYITRTVPLDSFPQMSCSSVQLATVAYMNN